MQSPLVRILNLSNCPAGRETIKLGAQWLFHCGYTSAFLVLGGHLTPIMFLYFALGI